jgi:hypothetical protein
LVENLLFTAGSKTVIMGANIKTRPGPRAREKARKGRVRQVFGLREPGVGATRRRTGLKDRPGAAARKLRPVGADGRGRYPLEMGVKYTHLAEALKAKKGGTTEKTPSLTEVGDGVLLH